MTKTCPDCSCEVDEFANYCPSCNHSFKNVKPDIDVEEQKVKYCSNCGKKVEPDFLVCPYCKKEVKPGVQLQHFHDDTNKYSSNYTTSSEGIHETSSLVLGIIGTICVGLNFLGVPYIHILGFILGIVGFSLANSDKNNYGPYSKRGYTLSLLAIIAGAISFFIGAIIGCLYY